MNIRYNPLTRGIVDENVDMSQQIFNTLMYCGYLKIKKIYWITFIEQEETEIQMECGSIKKKEACGR